MIIRQNELSTETREKVRDGEGVVAFLNLLHEKNFNMPVLEFAVLTLNKDCSVGSHRHNGDKEIIYCLNGEAELNDNGNVSILKKGDVNICLDGEHHSMKNYSEVPFEFIILVVKS